ncbi:MAG: hypothetical protein VKK59_01760 [Vampirovibrionales bacterium]|nr:hypothetical protein [Vampirovibrionales bacterium]
MSVAMQGVPSSPYAPYQAMSSQPAMLQASGYMMPSPAMSSASPAMPAVSTNPMDSFSALQGQPPMDPSGMSAAPSGGVPTASPAPASAVSGSAPASNASGAFQMNPDGSVRQVGQKTSEGNPLKSLLLIAAAVGAAVFGYNKFLKPAENPDAAEVSEASGAEEADPERHQTLASDSASEAKTAPASDAAEGEKTEAS